MAVETAQQIQLAPETRVERWRFTVDDFYRMGELGIIPPDARVELVDGDVFKMAPIGSHHQGSVDALDEMLRERLGRRVTISIQGPLNLGPYGTPQPDVMVLKRRDDHYRTANPTAPDVFLVIEVSDTTLAHDRDTKGPMYARAEVAEYWIADLARSRLLVFCQPAHGEYRSMQVLVPGDTVQPASFPDVSIAVAEIFA
jgi:Uma2 family endonuclease